jgi:Ca2+/Na+ antiporter
MSPPLTYAPAYFGLFASLMLAIACNAFLDIQYGIFGIEVMLWGGVFAWTLLVGWRQGGQVNENGKQWQKNVLIIGAVLTVVVFFPVWGLPRAGLYLLAMLQAANNCVSTTRRQLHFGLLVSVVMALFAAAHGRADWTLLFYLLPYILAVVFTLVSEQISRRADDLRQKSLGQATSAGQSAAITAATVTILFLGASLYLITPQVTWPYLHWHFGQPSNIGLLGEPLEKGRGGQSTGQTGEAGKGSASQSSGSAADGGAGQGYQQLPGSGLPTSAQMREAAKRPGMPGWQSVTIVQMANLGEAVQQTLAPVLDALDKLWDDLKNWLKDHRPESLATLLGLILLAILIALARLFREANAFVWLGTRYDYVRLGILAWHGSGNLAADRYYRAMEKLFSLAEMPRSAVANTREYLHLLSRLRSDLRQEIAELTLLFEQSRYGNQPLGEQPIRRMREVYLQIYRKLGQ